MRSFALNSNASFLGDGESGELPPETRVENLAACMAEVEVVDVLAFDMALAGAVVPVGSVRTSAKQTDEVSVHW